MADKPQIPPFPTMLRQMWSGNDVQQWLNENVIPLYAHVVAELSLKEATIRQLREQNHGRKD